MSRELSNGATGWRFAAHIITGPYVLAWTLGSAILDELLYEAWKVREARRDS